MTQAAKRVLVLLGMPGVGKGTQAQFLSDKYNLYHIDTGQTLRNEITLGTPLGQTAKSYMDKGELVPFDLVIQVIKAAMLRISPEQKGYLFDGFPRNLDQATGLNTILSELGLKIDTVLYLETPRDILMDRLAYRVSCSQCDAKYNLKLNPPKNPEYCDVCGGKLITRKDDRPEVIEARLNAYFAETAPLVDFYEQQDLLKRIDANQSIQTVFEAIQQQVDIFFSPLDKIVI